MTVAKLENMCMISTLKNGKRYAEWSKLYSLTVVTTGENSCVLQIQCSDHKLLYSLAVVTTGENNCVLQCSDHKLLRVQSDNLHLQMTACSPPQTNNSTQCQAMLTQRHNG